MTPRPSSPPMPIEGGSDPPPPPQVQIGGVVKLPSPPRAPKGGVASSPPPHGHHSEKRSDPPSSHVPIGEQVAPPPPPHRGPIKEVVRPSPVSDTDPSGVRTPLPLPRPGALGQTSHGSNPPQNTIGAGPIRQPPKTLPRRCCRPAVLADVMTIPPPPPSLCPLKRDRAAPHPPTS